MTLSKLTMLGAAVALLSLSTIAQAAKEPTADEQKEIDEVVGEFKGLKPCDGSKRAENVCKKNCTGAGYLWGVGTCSHQEVWNKCATHCRTDWIKNCIATATNETNNLKSTAACK